MLSGEDGRALMLPPPLPPPLTAAPNVDAARGGVGVCSAWRVLPPTAADEKGGGVGVSGWSPAAEDGRDEKRRRLGRHGRLSQVSSSGSGASRGAPGGAADAPELRPVPGGLRCHVRSLAAAGVG